MSDAANNAPLQQGPSAPLQAVVAGRGLNRRLRGSRRWTTVLPVTLFAIATSCELSWAMAPRYQESTDDAYLTGNTVQVTADIAGTVVAIGSEDNQFVHAGQLVVALDDTDARIAVERAKTNLDNTAREVRRIFASMAVSAGRFDTTSVSSNPDVLGADDQVDVAYLEHPLQLGLSMSVAVDTQERKDARPTDLATEAATRFPSRYKTLCRPNFGSDMHEAMEWQARLF
jgi:multidrug efflux pump subunit AcrA (membrane-fusion protein)